MLESLEIKSRNESFAMAAAKRRYSVHEVKYWLRFRGRNFDAFSDFRDPPQSARISRFRERRLGVSRMFAPHYLGGRGVMGCSFTLRF
jgi:hypothetical protein